MCPPIRMNSKILYSTSNVRGALCLAKHVYCIKSSQLWQGEAVIWCNLSLFCSIQFLPLFGRKKKSCLLELWWNLSWMWENWALCHRNLIIFSIRKKKNKNKLYKVHLSRRRIKKKKKKNRNQFSQVQAWRLRMKFLSKGIGFRSNTRFFGIWILVKFTYSHLNEISIISFIVSQHKNYPVFFSYLFIYNFKESKKR